MSGSVVPCSECGCNTYNNQDPCQHCVERILHEEYVASEPTDSELDRQLDALIESDKQWGFYSNKS